MYAKFAVRPGPHPASPFIFGFDAQKNTLGQFLVMSAAVDVKVGRRSAGSAVSGSAA